MIEPGGRLGPPGALEREVLRIKPGDADWAKALATPAGQRAHRGE